jgi:hypothetical protein
MMSAVRRTPSAYSSTGHNLRFLIPSVLLLIALCLRADAQETKAPPETAAFVLKEVYDPVGQIPFRSGQAPLGMVEIQGVSAGSFKAEYWEKNELHWVPEARMPLLAPRLGGVYRNIYAPSVIEDGKGWRLFYAAWDGVDTVNDRVYSATTPDFIDFYDRHTVIEHGVFMHVSNVNVQRAEGGALHAIATALVGGRQANKPVYFSSPDGRTWNGSPEPYTAAMSDIVAMEGYADYEEGDENGANVLLRDHGKWILYFTNWRDPGKCYWAQGETPARFKFGSLALATGHAVNDVKQFSVDGKDHYVMALHKKGDVTGAADTDKLWYSLSNDGRTFGKEIRLPGAREEQDRYIFAVGFVTRKDRIMGLLYGAGASERCERNRIFGYWLQKRVLLTAQREYTRGNGLELEAAGALGPDRQWFKLPQGRPFEGTITVFAEDGITRLGTQAVTLQPGVVYRLEWATAGKP